MTCTLTTNLLLCYLYTTAVTYNTFIADTLVFATGALVVLGRTEDALAEQTVALGLVRTVVDGLRLGHLATGVLKDLLGRGKTDSNLGEITLYLCIFLESHIINFSIFQLLNSLLVHLDTETKTLQLMQQYVE